VTGPPWVAPGRKQRPETATAFFSIPVLMSRKGWPVALSIRSAEHFSCGFDALNACAVIQVHGYSMHSNIDANKLSLLKADT
jgi:hypothetical protein